MKFLNSNNLYFPVTIFGLSPINNNIPYRISIVDKNNTSTVYNTYTGSIFYYNTNLKIYFDFLLDNIKFDDVVPEFTSITASNKIGTVTVNIYDNNNTLLANDDIVLSAINNKGNIYTQYNDLKYYVNTGSLWIAYDQYVPDVVEEPRIIPMMKYMPILVWANSGTGHYTGTLTTSAGNYSNINKVSNVIVPVDSSFGINYNRGTGNTGTTVYKFDTVCAPYALIWYDNAGFWQCQPFWGRKKFDYTYGTITNLNRETGVYEIAEDTIWQLKSDYVKKYQTYLSLFTSQYVYLFVGNEPGYFSNNAVGYSTYKVIVDTNTYSEVVSKIANKFTVDVKLDKNLIIK